MNFAEWFDSSFSLQFSTALLHFLWQGCAIGATVVVGGVLLRRAPAQWRYLLNVSALLLMAACLPVTFALLDASQATPPVGSDGTPAPFLADATPVVDVESQRDAFSGAVDTRIDARNGLGGIAVERASTPVVIPDSLTAYAPYFTVIYFIGVALMLVRMATGLRGGHRLRKTATAINDDPLLAMIGRQARQIGLRCAPPTAWCREISIPVVIGIVKPMVLLPAALATGLSLDQTQALITHELAHIRRCDLLVNMLQRLIEAVLFFHPAVWYVSRRVSVERENATDDMVLAAGWRPPQYADALVRMAELSSALRNTRIANQAATLAASGTNASDFKRRVMRLVDGPEPTPVRLTRGGMAALAVLLLMALSAPIAMHALAQSPATDPNAEDPDEQAATSPRPATESEVPVPTTIDRSRLPRVAESFQQSTTVLGRLVSGGGIIERIEDDVVYFGSGDHVEIERQTAVFSPGSGDEPPRMLKADVLEAGMVVSYSMRDGRIDRLVLVGILEQPPTVASVFDTIKELELRRGNEVNDLLDGRFPIRVTGKDGPVLIAMGETKLIDLPEPTMLVEWQIADYQPEGIDDFEEFDYLLVQWRSNGRITWTCYQSPEVAAENDTAESPSPTPSADERSEIQELQRELEQIQSLETAADGEADPEKRVELLRPAAEEYEEFYTRYRTTLAGLRSRFYQARCLQQLDEREAAREIFDELLELADGGEQIEQLKADVRDQLESSGDLTDSLRDRDRENENLRADLEAAEEQTALLHLRELRAAEATATSVDVSDVVVTDDDLVVLSQLPRLKQLVLMDEPVTDDGRVLSPVLTDAVLGHLSGLEELESLDVNYLPITDMGLRSLAGLPGLRHLGLRSTAITDAGLPQLSGFDRLVSLDLAVTDVTDVLIEQLAALSDLTTLDVARTRVTDAGLEHLARFQALTKLRIGGPRITDDGMPHVFSIPNLSELSLFGTEVTDEGLKQVSDAEALSVLVVQNLHITDAALESIAACENLVQLSLSAIQVTDAGLEHLHGLKNVERMFLRVPGVSQDAIDALREALPQARIRRLN